MKPATGFFSYTRFDDSHNGGALSDIRHLLAAEVRAQTGSDFEIFQDIEDILIGQQFQKVIHTSLDETSVLIVVMTPAFFKSDFCRSEVSRFLDREVILGRDDLIIPIYYIQATAMLDAEDEIANSLRVRQYVDWRPLRFEPTTSSAVRRAIAELAAHVVAAIERTPLPSRNEPAVGSSPPQDDDAPGFLELIAEAEEAIPLFSDAIVEIGKTVELIGSFAEEADGEMQAANRAPNSGAAKLFVARRLAGRLDEPATELEAKVETYLDQLPRVDGGVMALADMVADLNDDSDIEAAGAFHEALKELAAATDVGLSANEGLIGVLRDVGRTSSTIRPVFRRMERALAKMVTSRDVFERWVRTFEIELAKKTDQS